jgi:hypothetical protein
LLKQQNPSSAIFALAVGIAVTLVLFSAPSAVNIRSFALSAPRRPS